MPARHLNYLLFLDTARDDFARATAEAFQAIARSCRVVDETEGKTVDLRGVDAILLTSARQRINETYFNRKVEWSDKWPLSILMDTTDLHQLVPDYDNYDLVFRREYSWEHTSDKKIIPINNSLCRTLIKKLREYSKPWHNREIDVFFRGQTITDARKEIIDAFHDKPFLNIYGMAELVVDVAGERMSQDEFYKTLGNSKVVLSPVGGGWDCTRHQEAIAAGCYPLMSYHWHWHPTGYQSIEDAMLVAQQVLVFKKPRWKNIILPFMDAIKRARWIMGYIEERIAK